MNKQKIYIKQFLNNYAPPEHENRTRKIINHLSNDDLIKMFLKFNGQLSNMSENMYNHLEKLANKREMNKRRTLVSLNALKNLPNNMKREVLHRANL